MTDISGEFELHLTAEGHDAERLRIFATDNGMKFSHIVLDRGTHTSQPMLTLRGSGTLTEQIELGRQWARRMRQADLGCRRIKAEAAPDNEGVPRTDAQAVADRYFEHHVKLLLPDDELTRRIELAMLVTPHHARLSRNAYRERPDGAQERFVTQRCHHAGRATAHARLTQLLAVLRETGYPILQVEEEYVGYDSWLAMDDGWLTPPPRQENWEPGLEDRMRTAPAGREMYPSTYQPIEANGVRQRGYFDPALKQFFHAYQAGNPVFADPAAGQAWRDARWAAILAALGAIADSPFADQLVLRGSVPLLAIFGDRAREPGDLDFVVTPPTMSIRSWQAKELLDGVTAAAGFRTDEVSIEDIWTYERAAGKRLLFPFQADGLPRGSIQLDFVFHEPLPLPAELIVLDGLDAPILAAPPALALAWKLQWLATDSYPQAKDLYDAMLLAEHTDADPDLVRELIRPELGTLTDEFGPETVLAWSMDWANCHDQYPGLPLDGLDWQDRLALAMTRFWH